VVVMDERNGRWVIIMYIRMYNFNGGSKGGG
jgi:hypothetical protein